MEGPQEEQYVFQVFAHVDIGEAIICLKKVPEQQDGFVKWCLLTTAVVCYCRPFTECNIKNGQTLMLKAKKFVPKEKRVLHRQLTEWRNQFFAHSDLQVRSPKLYMWNATPRPTFGIGARGVYLETVMEQYDPMQELFNDVLQRLEVDIRKREEMFRREHST